MLARNVKVMDVVGEVVAIGEDAGARTDREMKGETALVGVERGCMRVSIMDSETGLE